MGKKTLWPAGFGLEELNELKSKLNDLGLTTKVIQSQEDIIKYNKMWNTKFGPGNRPKKAHGGKVHKKTYAKGGGMRKAQHY